MQDDQDAVPENSNSPAEAAKAARSTQEELELKREELALKREEFQARLDYQKHERRMSVSPILVAAIAALAGISGSVVGSLTQYISEARKFELEAKRAQSSMIFEAIRTGDPDKAAENLQFLLETGLLVDPNGSLRAYLVNRKPSSGAKLPSGSPIGRSGSAEAATQNAP